MTLYELTDRLMNKENVEAIIIFKQGPWFKQEYPEISRSYKTNSSWGKWFKSGMIGKSLIGNCLDGTDNGVRLDWYIGEWEVERCYIVGEEDVI